MYDSKIGSIVPQDFLRKKFKLLRSDLDGNRELVQTGVEDVDQLIQSAYSTSLDYILDRFLDGDFFLDNRLPADMTDDFLLDALDISSSFVENMEEARDVYGFPADWSYEQIRVALNDKLNSMTSEVKKDAQTQNSTSQATVETEE